MEKYINQTEVCKILGLNPSSVFNVLKCAGIVHHGKNGRNKLYLQSEITNLKEKRGNHVDVSGLYTLMQMAKETGITNHNLNRIRSILKMKPAIEKNRTFYYTKKQMEELAQYWQKNKYQKKAGQTEAKPPLDESKITPYSYRRDNQAINKLDHELEIKMKIGTITNDEMRQIVKPLTPEEHEAVNAELERIIL